MSHSNQMVFQTVLITVVTSCHRASPVAGRRSFWWLAMDADEETLEFMNLMNSYNVPLAFHAVTELGVIEILGEGAMLSSAELISRMPGCKDRELGAGFLDRILRLLASHKVLAEDVVDGQRRYGITRLCSLAAPMGYLGNEVLLKPWFYLHELVLDGACPFEKAHGKSFYEMTADNPALNKNFEQGMTIASKLHMLRVLECYRFDGIQTLVDVGGGLGTCLASLHERLPHIQGINFDLPHVIAKAENIPGVKHIAGDMFKDDIPSGDAIFMKWVLHNWSDLKCVELLKNCLKSIPSGGKVIAVEGLLASGVDHTLNTRINASMDLNLMLNMSGEGRERTLDEYVQLGKAAGFTEVKVAAPAAYLSVLEFLK